MTTDQTDHRADPVQTVAEAIWASLRRPDQGGFTHAGGYIDPDAGIIDVCVSDMTKVAEAAVAAARPAIEREAKAAALREAADRIDLQAAYEHDGSEYRNAESAAESWLREEAHRIEREVQP